MSETAESTPDEETPDEPRDLAELWPELRRAARANDHNRSGRGELWLVPVLLLYVGFLFGPFMTVLAAVFTLKGRISVRHAALLTGVAGTAWCLMQGISMVEGAAWSEIQLQGLRSGLNFVNGVVAYVTVRHIAVRRFRLSRRTVFVTMGVILLAIGAYWLVPSTVLIAMGR